MSLWAALTCAIERYRIGQWIDRGYYHTAATRITEYVDSTLARLGVKPSKESTS